MPRTINKIIQSRRLSSYTGTPEGHLGGGYARELEDAFCDYFKVKYAVAMNSATACLHAAMVACNLTAGDEVVVSSYSFSSSASCVLMAGAKPIFADIQDDIYCIDPASIEDRITGNTRAIIPVHLFGHPADMQPILQLASKYHLMVIEDAAQAITAKYKGVYAGTIGDCGVFSFNQAKQINVGEGGMLITNDEHIARVARAVRNHGEAADPEFMVLGYNYRLCEVQAAMALKQFRVIDQTIQRRRENADELSNYLKHIGIEPMVVYPDCTSAYYRYAIRTKRKLDGFVRGYVEPLYMLPIYRRFGYGKGLCPTTEKVNSEIQIIDVGG